MISCIVTYVCNHCFNNRYILATQSCVVDRVNFRQWGTNQSSIDMYVIVPRSRFSCNGRITGYMASLYWNYDEEDIEACSKPRILIWHPLNRDHTMYSVRNATRLRNNLIKELGDYYFAKESFTGTDRIEIQSGDVIGYQQRLTLCYTVWSNEVDGYTSYDASSITDDTININDSSATAYSNLQPLIQVDFGTIYVRT